MTKTALKTSPAPAHQHHLVGGASHHHHHVSAKCYLRINVTGWTWLPMTPVRPQQMTRTVNRDLSLMVVVHERWSLQEKVVTYVTYSVIYSVYISFKFPYPVEDIISQISNIFLLLFASCCRRSADICHVLLPSVMSCSHLCRGLPLFHFLDSLPSNIIFFSIHRASWCVQNI